MPQRKAKQARFTPGRKDDDDITMQLTTTRKRDSQSRASVSDNKPSKRVKAETKRLKTTTPKTRSKKATSKNATEKDIDFAFEVKQPGILSETPRLPARKDHNGVDDQSSIESEKNDDQTLTDSDGLDSDGTESVGSISIQIQGSQKKISQAEKRRRQRLTGEKNLSTAAESLAESYNCFNPAREATWDLGKCLPFKVLSDTFEAIEATKKRLEISRHLTELFRCILTRNRSDLLPAVYLCVNKVAPSHEGLELGIGDATLVKAIANVSGGGDVARIKKQYEASGDLGLVAVSRKGCQNVLVSFKELTVADVFKRFKEIAAESGQKSQERKRRTIESLLNASSGKETKYIVRALQGKLRIGLAEQTVLQSIGQAFYMEQREAASETNLMGEMEQTVDLVKQVYSTCPSYDRLIATLFENGITHLEQRIIFTPGIPVQPMLAKATNGVEDALDKFGDRPFICEFKYDGERSQVHVIDAKTIRIYTRNAENVSGKFPDVAEMIRGHLKPQVETVVLDCETVAFDRATNKLLPFQRLSTRPRKDVKIEDIKVHVCVFCFDCLYLNGESLLKKPLQERRQVLNNVIDPESGLIQFAEHRTSNDVEELRSFLDMAVNASTEGLIVKTLDCSYEPSKRSVNWLKLKKDYLDGVGDSFDLVVIGAWHGRGKRTGVFGSYLLAVYDPVTDEYQSISKIGTGFSEEELEQFTARLKAIQISKPCSNYRVGETPDVWVDPLDVWEVKAADLSISPVHQAAFGILDDTKGISIRFPRLVRVREDKKATDATTSEQVVQMYKDQAAPHPTST